MIRTPRLLLVVIVAGLAFVTGCGGGSDSNGASADGGGASDGMTTLTVGVLPISAVAPLYVGVQQGYFKDEKLNIKPQIAQGGAAVIPAVMSGNFQVGFAGTVPMLLAASQGLGIRIIAQANEAGNGDSAVLVPKDSPIKTAADLNGKTIAVNALKSVGDVTIREAARKAGADPSTFKFTEIDFPDMLTAVKQSRIDAIWEVEPFVTLAKSQGMRVIVEPFTGTEPNLTVSTWFASDSYISSHKDVIDRFVRAMNRSLEYSDAHPDAVRKVLPTFTSIKPDLATKIALPHFTTDLNVPSIDLTAKLMKDFGITDTVPDVTKLVGNGG